MKFWLARLRTRRGLWLGLYYRESSPRLGIMYIIVIPVTLDLLGGDAFSSTCLSIACRLFTELVERVPRLLHGKSILVCCRSLTVVLLLSEYFFPSMAFRTRTTFSIVAEIRAYFAPILITHAQMSTPKGRAQFV